jgi:hypothetical protein
MQVKKIILSIFLFPFILLAQEDSTVYLKPFFKEGDELTFSFKDNQVKEVDGNGEFLQENYTFQTELLKTAYGLSVFKLQYKTKGNPRVSGSNMKSKDDLIVYFTIDSNRRYVAIENKKQLFDSLAMRLDDQALANPDSIYIENFFPEIELLFFLNGAKYVIGEIYETETIILTEFVAIPCVIKVEMTAFNRKENAFEINCEIAPKDISNHDFLYKMDYHFSLHDLRIKSIKSNQSYSIGEFKYNRSLSIESL